MEHRPPAAEARLPLPSLVWRLTPLVLLVGVVGVLDYLTGTEISFSIFYLIPVALGTWLLGRRVGFGLAVLSALAWYFDDALLGSRPYSHPWIPVWNATMRCGVFLLMAAMLAQLQRALGKERRALAALSVAHSELDRSGKEQLRLKDQLLSHVSHELRTPLTAIHQFITIPLDGLAGPLSEQQRDCLATALRNVDQLTRLIGDLLDSARLETGKIKIDARPLALPGVIGDAIRSLESTAGERGVKLRDRCPAELPPVLADASRVRQVLYNLIDNAIKFSPARGTVTVEATVTAGSPGLACVTVTDTGRGLSEAVQKRLFQRQFQEERNDEAGRQGLGLGLYISREIVMRHGGSIWAENAAGAGARFSFTLPLVGAAERAGEAAQARETAP